MPPALSSKSRASTEFGECLRSAREKSGFSRRQLAEQAGLDGSHVFRLETGDRHPSRATLFRLAEALAVNGQSLDDWLAAAGYAAVPLLRLARGAVRTRGRGRPPSTSSSSPDPGVAQWAAWLEAMGLEEAAIRRLLRAVETAEEPERQGILKGISKTISHAIERLEAPVKTAVIPAAGGQHRLLASHVMQGLLLRAIGEAFESGISNVILILAPGMIDSVYAPLRNALDLLTGPPGQIRHAVQPEPRGLGDAILHAEDLVGEQPFAVLLPDDMVDEHVRTGAGCWVLRRMMNVFGNLGNGYLLAVTPVPKSMLPRYGVVQVAPDELMPGVFTIVRLVEKPERAHAICRSRRTLGVVGRYILQPSIFQPLRDLKQKGRAPLQVTDALECLRKDNHTLVALQLKVARKDVGQALSRVSELIAAGMVRSSDQEAM